MTNILDLNDYCLGTILKYLATEDHVSFAQSCARFRQTLKDWSCTLYPQFELSRHRHKDLDALRAELKLCCIIGDVLRRLKLDIREVERNNVLCEGFTLQRLYELLKSMRNLEHCELKEESRFGALVPMSIRNVVEPFQFIENSCAAFECLPNLQSVNVDCNMTSAKAYSLCKLQQVQQLSIYNQIAAEDLSRICGSNAKLRKLTLREIVGDISALATHCQHLLEISLPISSQCPSYAAIAHLPSLQRIIIKGSTQSSPCAKTLELFAALAANAHTTQLRSLILYPSLDAEETSGLAKLHFLRELRCTFNDAQCIEQLTALQQLEDLYIMLGRSHAGAEQLLSVLRSCKQLQRLHINSNLTMDFVLRALQQLQAVRQPSEQQPLQLYVTGLLHLCKEDAKIIDSAYCTLVDRAPWLR
ncbi:CG12520 [Drosophila busckii]|uniref:CG12520 n=1 Tax=Drosophila busckii TaxID=30019 RepID=A0A0M4EHT5_DROBS|nr:uncharacterized protein LOC108599041 [Drosophila busckii]ALC43314.1 CG12520 [Drosophila busckii]